jgi:hypothetical protein
LQGQAALTPSAFFTASTFCLTTPSEKECLIENATGRWLALQALRRRRRGLFVDRCIARSKPMLLRGGRDDCAYEQKEIPMRKSFIAVAAAASLILVGALAAMPRATQGIDQTSTASASIDISGLTRSSRDLPEQSYPGH